MNVVVFGAGAVGTYLGARLAAQGHEVVFVGRKPFVDAVSRDGVRVQLATSQLESSHRVRAVERISELESLKPDATLVCVKAYAVEDAIAQLRETANRSPLMPFVTFQNGIGAEDSFALAFGEERIVAATTTTPVSLVAPGVIRVEKKGGVGLALVSQSQSPRGSLFGSVTTLHALRDAFDARLYNDWRAMKWSKLLLNVIGNALGAILDMSVSELYREPRTFGIELAMLREVLAVMRALKLEPVNLPSNPAATLATAIRTFPARALQPFLLRAVSRGRGDKLPSLHFDVVNRARRSEVHWLNGAVSRAGAAVDVRAPVNANLTEVLTDIVEGRSEWNSWRGNVARAVTTFR